MNAKQLKKFENGRITIDPPPMFQLDKYVICQEREWEWAVMCVDNKLMKLQSTPGDYAVGLPTSVIHHTQAGPEKADEIKRRILVLESRVVITDHEVKFEPVPILAVRKKRTSVGSHE